MLSTIALTAVRTLKKEVTLAGARTVDGWVWGEKIVSSLLHWPVPFKGMVVMTTRTDADGVERNDIR